MYIYIYIYIQMKNVCIYSFICTVYIEINKHIHRCKYVNMYICIYLKDKYIHTHIISIFIVKNITKMFFLSTGGCNDVFFSGIICGSRRLFHCCTEWKDNTMLDLCARDCIPWIYPPPPSHSGQWRFIWIPHQKCNNPDGHCFWSGW